METEVRGGTGNMKTIKLSDNQLTIVDDEDYEYVCSFGVWHSMKPRTGETYYAERKIKSKTTRMHRLISERIHGPLQKGFEVDHVNGQGLDNRRENLRVCSRRNNSRNSVSKGGASGYKGVKKLSNCERWSARIKVNYKEIYLGCFTSAEKAALAYNEAASKHFGEFARLNIIE